MAEVTITDDGSQVLAGVAAAQASQASQDSQEAKTMAEDAAARAEAARAEAAAQAAAAQAAQAAATPPPPPAPAPQFDAQAAVAELTEAMKVGFESLSAKMDGTIPPAGAGGASGGPVAPEPADGPRGAQPEPGGKRKRGRVAWRRE